MSQEPTSDAPQVHIAALYIQAEKSRRDRLIAMVKAESGIGDGHKFKSPRLIFYGEIIEFFDHRGVRFQDQNRTVGTRLNEIFTQVSRGRFSNAIGPLLEWLWDRNPLVAIQLYTEVGIKFHQDAPKKPENTPYIIDTIYDYFDTSIINKVTVSLDNTIDGNVAIGHDGIWNITIKRFEFFVEEKSLVLLTDDGSRRPVGSDIPERILNRLPTLDHVRVITWERGPQGMALQHDHYPLKIIV